MIGILCGIGTLLGLAGICWFEGVGALHDGPPETKEPEAPVMTIDEALKRLKEEKNRECQ
jgi:hypothetical protein